MSPRPAPVPPEEDDQLLERLRETFRVEAEAVAPFSGRTRSIAAIHDWAARRRSARRRVAGGVAAMVAIALIGVAAAAVANRPARSTSVGVSAPPTGQPNQHLRLPVVGGPARHGAGGDTAAPVASGAVPPGFDPVSATFVTPKIGYVLGTAPCGGGRCLLLASTVDGGSSWSSMGNPDPSASATAGLGNPLDVHLGMRFADQDHGWIYGYVGEHTPVLWWTNDGAATWKALSPPALTGGGIAALESTAGRAEAVVVRGDPSGVQMISAPQASPAWKQVSPSLPTGHTGQPAPQLVLQQTAGWLLEEDPTYVAGARLTSKGSWKRWSPDCGSQPLSGYRVLLAAVTTTDVFELCQATNSNGDAVVYQSGRAGDHGTWKYRAQTAYGMHPQAFSANTAGSFAVAGQQDGKAVIRLHTPSGSGTVWSGSGTFTELGFENPGQGIAIVRTAKGSRMLMTYKGGSHWVTVDFQTRPLSS